MTFVPIPHNWVEDVEHTRTWPVSVLTNRNGREQRLALSSGARETVRYRLTTATIAQAHAVTTPILAAAMATTPEARGLLRVPRWEDMLPLAADANIGDTTLTLNVPAGDALAYRRFADGSDVALWVPGPQTVVPVTLAASGAIGATTLTLAAPLATAWRAGTRVAPVSVVRLLEPLEWDRVTGTVATATLSVALDDAIAGNAVIASGQPGRAQRPAAASLTLQRLNGDGGSLYFGMQFGFRAVCRDAAGVVISAPGRLTWTSSDPSGLPMRVLDDASGFAYVESTGITGGVLTITVTEPASGLTASITFVAGGGA